MKSTWFSMLLVFCFGVALADEPSAARPSETSSVTEPVITENAVAAEQAPAADKEASSPLAKVAKPAKPVEPPPTPIELQPYRVRVSVAFDEHATLTPTFRHEVLRDLASLLDRTFGEMWQTTVDENPWLTPPNEEGLARLSPARVEAELDGKQFDKAFVVTMSLQGGTFRLVGSEWDRMIQQLSVRRERQTIDRRALTNELGLLIQDLFRPLLLIEGSEAGVARVRLRAGEFPTPDPSAKQLAKGAFFQPVLRFFNKQKEQTSLQMVPWTFLQVETEDRAIGTCSIHTALRVTLGKNSKRSESWAIGLKPAYDSTRLRITPHNNPTKALIGYQVNIFERAMVPAPPPAEVVAKPTDAKEAAESKPSADSKDSKPEATPTKPAEPQLVPQFNKLVELITDRRGQVVVPVDPQRPLIWMYVSSGGSILGRFPFIPGTQPSLVAELPDDSFRLHLESRLELLRAELIDSVARRSLVIARAKNAAKAADWAQFDEAMKEFDRQPNAKQFHATLDSIKVSAARKVDKKDKNFDKRVARLTKDTTELIDRVAADDRIKEQRNDLVELKSGEQDAAAGGGATATPGRPRTPAPIRTPAPKP